ncbi:hypothetical protein HDU96_007750 [Phlyctochytrium bullatum]|nr:hypothetical protein HDU96_007750 [Phlyctochytrium bullatum]
MRREGRGKSHRPADLPVPHATNHTVRRGDHAASRRSYTPPSKFILSPTTTFNECRAIHDRTHAASAVLHGRLRALKEFADKVEREIARGEKKPKSRYRTTEEKNRVEMLKEVLLEVQRGMRSDELKVEFPAYPASKIAPCCPRAGDIPLEPSTASHHIKLLREAGFGVGRTWISLSESEITQLYELQGIYRERFEAAARVRLLGYQRFPPIFDEVRFCGTFRNVFATEAEALAKEKREKWKLRVKGTPACRCSWCFEEKMEGPGRARRAWEKKRSKLRGEAASVMELAGEVM